MTRFTGIILENFKAFKHRQIIPIRPLTLIYGPNSAGKSSIIHALALLRHAFLNNGHAEADPVELGWSEVRLGGWQNLVHGHDGYSTFKIGLQFESVRHDYGTESDLTDHWEVVWEFGRNDGNSAATVITISALRDGQPEFDGRWDHAKQRWSLARFPSSLQPNHFTTNRFFTAYLKEGGLTVAEGAKPAFREWLASISISTIQAEGLFPNCKAIRKSEWDEYHENPPPDWSDNFLNHLFSPQDYIKTAAFGRDWSGQQAKVLSGIERVKSGCQPTDEETDSLQDIYEQWSLLTASSERPYESAALSFEAIIQKHFHLDPVRERPKFQLNLRDMPDSPKHRPWLKLITDTGLREQSSKALEILTRQPGQTTGYQLAMRNRIVEIAASDGNQSIKSTTPELSILSPQGILMGVDDVGYGISTVLPIVTALNNLRTSVISIEQPELHIHPRLQTEIGELFLKSSLGNRNNLLIETHSEHLILRILRRIRETTIGKLPMGVCPITNEDVAVLFVSPSSDGSTVKELRITPHGKFLDNWPGGFFEESFDEMF